MPIKDKGYVPESLELSAQGKSNLDFCVYMGWPRITFLRKKGGDVKTWIPQFAHTSRPVAWRV